MKFKLLALGLILLNTTMFAQSRVTLSGYIRDAASGEGLIGATVYIDEIKSGTVADAASID